MGTGSVLPQILLDNKNCRSKHKITLFVNKSLLKGIELVWLQKKKFNINKRNRVGLSANKIKYRQFKACQGGTYILNPYLAMRFFFISNLLIHFYKYNTNFCLSMLDIFLNFLQVP